MEGVINFMVKKNVLVNLFALCVLLGGFVMYMLREYGIASALILTGLGVYVYQKITKTEI